MISLVPRSPVPDSPPPAVALGLAVSAEAARTPRLKPVEAGEAMTAVRRGRDDAASSMRAASSETPAPAPAAASAPREGEAPTPAPAAWSGLESAPFMAQLIGQQAHQGDQMLSGRGPTSFRKSPIELYEQAHGWARRIEFLFTLDHEVLPAAA